MAKMNPLFVLVIVLVAAFLFLLLSTGQNFVPYDSNMKNYAKYEPMTALPPSDEDSQEKEKEKEKENEKGSINGLFSFASNVLPSFGMENFEPMVDEPQTIGYGPLRDSEIIDKFSQIKENGMDGVNGCVSSGLSNSGGYICLTPDLIQMLKTRGGNATGM